MLGLTAAASYGASYVYIDRYMSRLDRPPIALAAGQLVAEGTPEEVAEGVRRRVGGGGDTAARVGGEEFHVWAPGASLERGAEIAERIRVALAESKFSYQGSAWPITASFGVAGVPATSTSVHNLPVQADAALYVAKQRGRNRVEVAPAG